ncbi:CheR family methyltransferase [Acidisoma sp. C75]
MGGMPRNAIVTGAADLIPPLTSMPDPLPSVRRRMALSRAAVAADQKPSTTDWLPAIIERPRKKTAPDVSLYKEGRLCHRIERRMAMASTESGDIERYLDLVKAVEKGLERLDFLSAKTLPDLVRGHSIDQPPRSWIAGCSTGEETYALAILSQEEITAARGQSCDARPTPPPPGSGHRRCALRCDPRR